MPRLRIVFHGEIAHNFEPGFSPLLGFDADIPTLRDALITESECEDLAGADVIMGTKLDAKLPKPLALKLFHAPAAGTDATEVSCLPLSQKLCICFCMKMRYQSTS